MFGMENHIAATADGLRLERPLFSKWIAMCNFMNSVLVPMFYER